MQDGTSKPILVIKKAVEIQKDGKNMTAISAEVNIQDHNDLLALMLTLDKLREVIKQKMMDELVDQLPEDSGLQDMKRLIKQLEKKTPAELEQLAKDIMGLMEGR